MKKIVSAFLVLCLLLGNFSVFAAPEAYDINQMEFGETVEIGIPLRSSYILKCAISEKDGVPIAGTVTSGTPGMFNVVNLNDGTLVKSAEIPKGETFWVVESDSQGNIYFGGYVDATLYRYSPVTNEVEDLGRIPDCKSLISMDFDDNDNPYLGTFPNGSIVKYDLKQKKFVSLGKQAVNDQYVKSLAYYNNKIYFGKYGGGMHMLDLKTGKRTDIPVHPKYDKMDGVGKLSTAGKYLYGIVYFIPQGSTSYINVFVMYDMDQEKWLDFVIENVEGQYVSPEKDGKVYYNMKSDNMVYGLDLETKAITPTGINVGLMRGDGFANITSGEVQGQCYVNATYEGGISVLNFDTGKRVDYMGMLDGSPANTRDMEFGSDNRLYVGEMMGSKGAQWDLVRDSIAIFPVSQTEGMSAVGDRMIMGTYGKAVVYDLDTTKPIGGDNPYNAGSLGDGQDRPFAVKEADGKAILGSISTYGELGGALSIYDLETKKADVYRNLIPEQSILGLAYKDGIIYGSTTVSGGLNISPTKKEAEIFKFDMEKRELIQSVVPKVNGAAREIGAWGELTFGPEGLLWAYTEGFLIALDPETLEVKKQLTLAAPQSAAYGQYWTPFNLRFLEQGFMAFSDNGKLTLLDTKTMQLKRTELQCSAGMIVGPDNNIYYPMGSKVMMIPVYYGKDDVKKATEGTLSLFLGSEKAFKGTMPAQVDPYNKNIRPVETEGRTLLPLRFLGEALGAEVGWDDSTQTASVILGETTVKVPIGGTEIDVNGTKQTIDVPAATIEDRTFLPLRAVAEALDKSIVWDDRGLIVVCEKGGDSQIDKNAKDFLVSKFEMENN